MKYLNGNLVQTIFHYKNLNKTVFVQGDSDIEFMEEKEGGSEFGDLDEA